MLESAASFTDYWAKARARTVRVLEALPEEDLEWACAPGGFTFGDLFRHLAGLERFLYAEHVAGQPGRYPGHAASLAAGSAQVRAYLEQCHRESLAIFGSLSEAGLQGRCAALGGGPIPVWKWLRAMTEHEAHHRGQLYLMASLRGLTITPLFGLKEEQVVAPAAARPLT